MSAPRDERRAERAPVGGVRVEGVRVEGVLEVDARRDCEMPTVRRRLASSGGVRAGELAAEVGAGELFSDGRALSASTLMTRPANHHTVAPHAMSSSKSRPVAIHGTAL